MRLEMISIWTLALALWCDMGRATIVDEVGSGQYTVNLDYGDDALQAKISTVTAQLASLNDTFIPEIESTIDDTEIILSANLATLNAAIDAWAAVNYPEEGAEREAIQDATIDAQVTRRQIDGYNRALANANIEKRSLELKLAELQRFDLTQTSDVWCVDYTLEASGLTGTIEVPGEPALTLLAPGCAPPVAADGTVTGRVVQASYQSYWNIAALPGWQKWLPTYRTGVITAIDRANNNCDINLDEALSTAQYIQENTNTKQNFNINQTDTLDAVTFEYMNCNHRAFNVGDEVVVKFEGQDWAQPLVIGFKSNPNSCGFGIARANYYFPPTSTTNGTWQSYFAYDERDILEELRSHRANPQITIQFRREGESEWTTVPLTGYNLTSVAPPYPIGWVWELKQEFNPGIFRNLFSLNIVDIEWRDLYIDMPYSSVQKDAIVLYNDFETWPMRLLITRSAYAVPVGFEEIIGDTQVDEARIIFNGREYFRVAFQTRTHLYYGVRDVDQLTEEEVVDMIPSTGPASGVGETIGFLEDYDFPPDP